MSTHYVGIDWSSGAWIAVVYSSESSSPDVGVFDEISRIWEEYGESAKRIAVDVPIGLCESRDSEECSCKADDDGEILRACDDLARTVIGPRSSSVFTTPAHGAAEKAADDETEYSEVNETNRELTGKGLMKQAANISSGIIEVETLLLDGDGDSDILVEGHPEVCFRAFNGKEIQHSKKTAPGVDERLSALERVDEYDEQHWRVLASELADDDRSVGVDDLLDALALALTAAADDGDLQRLPPDPPMDVRNLPMQMVYRADSLLLEK